MEGDESRIVLKFGQGFDRTSMQVLLLILEVDREFAARLGSFAESSEPRRRIERNRRFFPGPPFFGRIWAVHVASDTEGLSTKPGRCNLLSST